MQVHAGGEKRLLDGGDGRNHLAITITAEHPEELRQSHANGFASCAFGGADFARQSRHRATSFFEAAFCATPFAGRLVVLLWGLTAGERVKVLWAAASFQ